MSPPADRDTGRGERTHPDGAQPSATGRKTLRFTASDSRDMLHIIPPRSVVTVQVVKT
jgi:hypothetical protein